MPHICDEILNWIERVSKISTDDNNNNSEPDICLIELGGTIGDIESMPFVEALNQLRVKIGTDNLCHLHVSLVPIMGSDKNESEHKTKPTQNSIKEIRRMGLYPDFILCRSSHELTYEIRQKISSTCHIEINKVISCHDVNNLFSIPFILSNQNLNNQILIKLNLSTYLPTINLLKTNLLNKFWNEYIDLYQKSIQINESSKEIKIGIVGKYVSLKDSYLSITKALEHACLYNLIKLKIIWIDSEKLEISSNDEINLLKNVDGILIPGGFGKRGVNGKIFASKYARENNIPFLGICFGLQIAVIEFARNVLQLKNATSEEFLDDNNNNIENLVVIYMPEIDQNNLGGTMRLGSKLSYSNNDKLTFSSKLLKLYNSSEIHERHRHRYEINPKYIDQFKEHGLIPVIFDKNNENNNDKIRCEAIELNDHPYYVAVQFHPEFKSTPYHPSPPFLGFILSIINKNYNLKCESKN